MNTVVYPGHPYPLGATWDGKGVNFALYAENAIGVDLCLFNSTNDDVENVKCEVVYLNNVNEPFLTITFPSTSIA